MIQVYLYITYMLMFA